MKIVGAAPRAIAFLLLLGLSLPAGACPEPGRRALRNQSADSEFVLAGLEEAFLNRQPPMAGRPAQDPHPGLFTSPDAGLEEFSAEGGLVIPEAVVDLDGLFRDKTVEEERLDERQAPEGFFPFWIRTLNEAEATRLHSLLLDLKNRSRHQGEGLGILYKRGKRGIGSFFSAGPSLFGFSKAGKEAVVETIASEPDRILLLLRLWARELDLFPPVRGQYIRSPGFLREMERQKLLIPNLRGILENHFKVNPRPLEERVLIDVGAGEGRITLALADLFGKVIAIEPDWSRYRALREKASARLDPVNGDILEMIAARPRLYEKEADVVLMSRLFYFLRGEADEQVLNWAQSALRPGGIAVTVLNDLVPTPASRAHLRKMAGGGAEANPFPGRFRDYLVRRGVEVDSYRPRLRLVAQAPEGLLAMRDLMHFQISGLSPVSRQWLDQYLETYVQGNLGDQNSAFDHVLHLLVAHASWGPFPLEPMEGETLPQKLRRLRAFFDLAQRSVAKGAGVKELTYRTWEKGIHFLYWPHLRGVADFYAGRYRCSPQAVRRFLGMKEPEAAVKELRGQTLAQVLQGLRISRWLLQREVVQEADLGVALRPYRGWEEGETVPTPLQRRKIAQFYQEQHRFPGPELYELLGVKTPLQIVRELKGKPLPQLLRDLEALTGASRSQIGVATGIKPSTYNKWKSGSEYPRLTSLRVLADYYVQAHGFPPEETYDLFGIRTPEEVLADLSGKPLPEVVRGLRRSVPLFQEEAAKALGMSLAAYARWEHGQVIPEPARLRALATYYSVQRGYPYVQLLRTLGLKTQGEALRELEGKDVSQVIRGLRDFTGESLQQVANALGIPKGSCENWEFGHLPSVARRQQLADDYATRHHFPLDSLKRLLGLKTHEEVMKEIEGGSLPKALRLLRKTQGLLQRDVADEIGIARSTYFDYETGKRIPGPDLIQMLATFYSQGDGFHSERLAKVLQLLRNAQGRSLADLSQEFLPRMEQMSRHYAGLSWEPVQDPLSFLSSAMEGFQETLEKYPVSDPRFQSLATIRMRQRILDQMRQEGLLSKSVIHDLRQLAEASEALFREENRNPTVEELAHASGLSHRRIHDILGVQKRSISLSDLLSKDSDGAGSEFVEQPLKEREQTRALVEDLLEEYGKGLSDRERYILKRYHLDPEPATMKQIGVELGLTESMVSKIHSLAIEKLQARRALEEAGESSPPSRKEEPDAGLEEAIFTSV